MAKNEFYHEKYNKYVAKANYLFQHLKRVHKHYDKFKQLFQSKSDLIKHNITGHQMIVF